MDPFCIDQALQSPQLDLSGLTLDSRGDCSALTVLCTCPSWAVSGLAVNTFCTQCAPHPLLLDCLWTLPGHWFGTALHELRSALAPAGLCSGLALNSLQTRSALTVPCTRPRWTLSGHSLESLRPIPH